MSEVYFYHLTRATLDELVPVLLERSLAAGWRVGLRAPQLPLLDSLDRLLWHGAGFLPHGMIGGAHDADQPVLLTTGPVTNGAQALISVGGAPVSAEEVAQFTRASIVFDGMDGAAVTQARSQWKALTGAGVKAKYWSQESGRWEMKAQSQ
ncbi:DNA polymerase III subunit chi [Aquimixticola soesokkakensis]|uniref:DNA polymerase III subunit chi n=1 Tax=Aquimixticola soesokkakensis TaxID=1519096 RepID=A0A1Y5TP14_9RHOB|nr:DNA polymerase III subunit chi [Aquimixticola soesokkakensis]SLN64902.1 DNA polymerase III subunit chi [Aquimixticola soesokkakensis]